MPFILMPIYTKKGDAGQTGLAQTRVAKSHQRIEALGAIDELNSLIGFCRGLISDPRDREVARVLEKIQHNLFRIQTEIAVTNPEIPGTKFYKITEQKEVKALEDIIDIFTKDLPPLTKFILPNGKAGSGLLQYARAVCRRTEREIVRLSEIEPIRPDILKYLNRLSDLLFTLARAINKNHGITEEHPDYYKES